MMMLVFFQTYRVYDRLYTSFCTVMNTLAMIPTNKSFCVSRGTFRLLKELQKVTKVYCCRYSLTYILH